MSSQKFYILEHRDVCRCPFCGKYYLRPQDVEYHINMKCRKNPENVHPCFWCEHLEKKDTDIVVSIGGAWGESEKHTTVPSFHCKKHDDWMYSALSCKHGHPCAEDGDHIPMPTTCPDFIYHDWKGNLVPWTLEMFIGLPQYKKTAKENNNKHEQTEIHG